MYICSRIKYEVILRWFGRGIARGLDSMNHWVSFGSRTRSVAWLRGLGISANTRSIRSLFGLGNNLQLFKEVHVRHFNPLCCTIRELLTDSGYKKKEPEGIVLAKMSVGVHGCSAAIDCKKKMFGVG